jgi:acyl carrier protein
MDAAAKVSRQSYDDIRGWLVETIAGELNVPAQKIGTEEEFTNLGLGSRQAILITGDLETFLNCDELDPSLLWDYPTIDKLARHLASQ